MTDRRDREVGARLDSLSDVELLSAVRSGDTGAYSGLYHRHLGAALAQARRLGGGHDPQDVAHEAFLKILRSILDGGGPKDGFAGYLMRAVRNEAIDRSRKTREIAVEDVEAADPIGLLISDGVNERIEKTMMQRALNSLPPAWQQILWLTEVEGLRPREVAPRLQLSPNAVAQLSRRARNGLRTAWLQAHVDVASAEGGCRATAALLGAYESDQLGAARAAQVEEHLEGCLRCAAALEELRQLSTGMRALLLPAVLGSPLLLGRLSDTLAGAGASLALATAQGVTGGGGTGGVVAGGGAAGKALWWKMATSLSSWPVVMAGSAVAVAGIVLLAQLPSTPGGSGRSPEASAVRAPVEAPSSSRPLPEATAPGGSEAEDPSQLDRSSGAADGASTVAPGGATPAVGTEPLEAEGELEALADGSAPVPAPTPEEGQPASEPATSPAPVAPPALWPLPPSMPDPSPGQIVEPPQEPLEPEPTEDPVEPTEDPVEPEPTAETMEEPEPTDEPTVPEPTEEPTTPVPTDEPTAPVPTEEPSEPEPALGAPTIAFPAGGAYAVPLTLSGEGTPGGVVRIRDADGREVGSSAVGEDGTWSISPTPGAPDVPTRYRATQEADGASSPSSAWTDEYLYLAPELLDPAAGSAIPANTSHGVWSGAWMVMTFGVVEEQGYAVIIDGQRWDLPAQDSAEPARYLALLGRGTHTIELVYVDPVDGRLGASRTVSLTVT